MERLFTVKNTVIGYGILLAVSFPGYYLAIRNFSGRTLDLMSIAIYYFVVTWFAIIIGEYFVVKLWLNKSVKYKKIEIISKWEKKIYIMIFLSFQVTGMIVLIVLQNASILFLLSGCCLMIVWFIKDTIYISADDLIYNARRIQINQIDKVTKLNRNSLKFVFKNGYTYIIKCRNLRTADEIATMSCRLVNYISSQSLEEHIIDDPSIDHTHTHSSSTNRVRVSFENNGGNDIPY